MPAEDCVGVGVPITTGDGAAVTADAVVTGATVAAAVVIAAPAVPIVEAAVVPPPLKTTMPVSASLMTAGVGSELIERLTVTSGFATSAGFWNCPVGCMVAETSGCPGNDGPRMRPRKPCDSARSA